MRTIQIFTLTLALFSAFFHPVTAQNQSVQDPGKLITELYTNIDAGNMDAVKSLLSADFSLSNPSAPVPLDKMNAIGMFLGFKTAFPDMKHEVIDWFASGNKAAIKGIFTGTNTGSMMGNPATGNKVVLPFNTIVEFDGNGKFKSINAKFDNKLVESQLMAGMLDQNAKAEATVRGILEAADQGDAEKLVGYFELDAIHYFAGQANTTEDLKKRVVAFKAGFPDIKRSVSTLSSNNGIVTLSGWLKGTNTGSFMGQPATGNAINVSVLGVYKVNAAGKVTEAWIELDSASLLAQLKGEKVNSGK